MEIPWARLTLIRIPRELYRRRRAQGRTRPGPEGKTQRYFRT